MLEFSYSYSWYCSIKLIGVAYGHRQAGQPHSYIERVPDQRKHLRELVEISDVTSVDAIRMNSDTFKRLYFLLENIGSLTVGRHVDIPEQVAMFLHIGSSYQKRDDSESIQKVNLDH